jgi:SAM-dependent methyltransferase
MITTKPALPDRYHKNWRDSFDAAIEGQLKPGISILDVGSGRKAAIDPTLRPSDCHYVGLDISRSELEMAAPGSYDEMWVRDVVERVPELEGRFDLIVSWQVFEHIKPLDIALENLRTYLKPGGQLVAMMSGKFSAFGAINAVVPSGLGVWGMQKLLRRDPDTVFPAHYHRCWDGALRRMLSSWQTAEIEGCYRGAGYFRFSGLLQRAYLAYENWAIRGDHRNLATHYVVTAYR